MPVIKKLQSFTLKSVLSLIIVFAGLNSAYANPDRLHDSTYQNWNVFSMNKSGKKICYIVSVPIREEGNWSKRGYAYLLVTDRGSKDEVSVSSGYPYRKGSEVAILVDDKDKMNMFTRGELAWTYEHKDDARLVNLMKRGLELTARGTSQKGTFSLDTFSLRGFTAAYNRMKRMCR